MSRKNLVVLVLADVLIALAFVVSYGKRGSFVPLYIGLLPLVLGNYIFAREFIAQNPNQPSDRTTNKLSVLPLLIMPIAFCLYLPALIRFDSSLGWSPVVSFGFSVLLCIVIIAAYGGIKTALKAGSKR